jgi:hypothetical protein
VTTFYVSVLIRNYKQTVWRCSATICGSLTPT